MRECAIGVCAAGRQFVRRKAPANWGQRSRYPPSGVLFTCELGTEEAPWPYDEGVLSTG